MFTIFLLEILLWNVLLKKVKKSNMQAYGIPKLYSSIWLKFCLYDSCSLNSYALVKTKMICDYICIFIILFYKCTQGFKAESFLKVLKEPVVHFPKTASTSTCLAYLHQKDDGMKWTNLETIKCTNWGNRNFTATKLVILVEPRFHSPVLPRGAGQAISFRTLAE